jgi:serine/threonine-protein kinase
MRFDPLPGRGRVRIDDRMQLERRIGSVLCGKWTLERLLGSGGMAAVYVGVHRIGRRDAIKILHPQIAAEKQLRARFDQEAYAVNRFVHPGAVEIRDIDVTEDGCPFLVMELLEGESLRVRCDRVGPPEVAEILRMADEVLDVLAAAHAQGIIHRDIKPDNLFCTQDGRIKVLDFGVARIRQAANALHTRTGTTLGTVAYMPPEQVKGMDVDARADVFALGATMFRLIAKRRIHEARSDAELLVKMATEPAPPLASVAPQAPASMCAIVDRALVFDRERRYPSAKAMQDDVRAVRKGERPAFALGGATAVVSGTPKAGSIDQDAATIVMHGLTPSAATPASPAAWASVEAQPTRLEQHGSVMAPVAPKLTSLTNLTALTQWTVTTLRERRLRWAAIVFPLIAAAVLALVFYSVTRVDSDENTDRRSDTTASFGAASPEAIAAAAPPVGLAQTEPIEPGEPVQAPEAAEQDSAQSSSCFLTNSCERICDRRCKMECTNREGCSIGATDDAMVHCRGPELCSVSCAGKCKVKSQRDAPLLVHCAPGFECEIDDCRVEIERCSASLFACGTPCPD